jgi:hypothetical protein
MSGSTIGGAIGFVVGSFFGMGQVGWMVGSAIGGYIDPEKIEGPRLSDARTQTSRDGVAIPFGWGTFPLAGNIIWQQPTVTEHKNTETQGKGGPEVTTFTYTRSYAVGLCEGPITGILQIKRNGKLVYDARDDATLEAEYQESLGPLSTVGDWFDRIRLQRAMNTRFMNNCEVYLGDETQTPDPTIESYEGVGNVPAYRGLAYIVVTDDDVTDLQGAIPQLEFVIAACGTTSTSTSGDGAVSMLAVGQSRDVPEADPCWATLDSLNPPSFVGIPRSTGANLDTNPSPACWNGVYSIIQLNDGVGRYSIDNMQTWVTSSSPAGFNTHTAGPAGFVGHAGGSTNKLYKAPVGVPAEYTEIPGAPEATANIRYTGSMYTLYGYLGDGIIRTWTSTDLVEWTNRYVSTVGAGYYEIHDIIEFGGSIYVAGRWFDGSISRYQFRRSDDGGYTFPTLLLEDNIHIPYHLESGNGILGCMTKDGYAYTSADNFATPVDTGLDDTYSSRNRALEYVGGYFYVLGALAGNLYYATASDDMQSWSSIVDTGLASVEALVGPEGGFVGEPLPDAPGWYVDQQGIVTGPGGTVVTPCEGVALSTIVGEICEMEGLTSDEYDVSQLEDIFVPGFRVANEGDAASAIAALMPAYFFDVGEWDGKVRFILRGGDSSFAINGDDLVERDGDAFERERMQEAELLRRVTVGYIDPAAAYGPTTQKWERRAGTVQAKGEASMELPLTLDADSAATIAKKRGLTAWGEPEKQKFSLPYRLAALTPTDVGTYTDDDGEIHTLRLMQAEDDSGIRYMEAATNSAEAYGATATGVSPKPPALSGVNLLGPTKLAVMDLPIWRSTDADDLGLYVAASGYFGAWQGTQIDVSTDEGVSYVSAATITAAATIGYTTTALTAWESSETPEEQEVTVYLPDAPASVDYATLLRYNNRAAVQLDSGAWEILQYQTVTALGDDLYTLSGLLRGRYSTTPGVVSANSTFVLLNAAVQFVRTERDYLDTTLTVRATTLGTSSDSAVPVEYDFSEGASQTEWPVHNVEAERDGSDNVTVTWVGRARLGTETSPYQSTHFTGYRVTFDDGVTEESFDTTDTTYTLASAADPITVTVAPLNDITGAGPASAGITV